MSCQRELHAAPFNVVSVRSVTSDKVIAEGNCIIHLPQFGDIGGTVDVTHQGLGRISALLVSQPWMVYIQRVYSVEMERWLSDDPKE